ncbi:hypothetical protein [Streptomyces liangshanensis]|uniref:hypothetical protein n=1 Tax=Streptomyces liangshanensis TaxID=2717324 RepID=UPI0036D88140
MFGRLDPRPLGTDRADRATTAQITEFADRLAAAAEPARVLDVVLRAAGPRERLRPRDLGFERR